MNDPQEIAGREVTSGQLSTTYDFFGQIGAGGMGVIYKARHRILNKDVAIKILHQVNEVTIQRFQREAQAAYNMHHENVVTVREFGVTEQGQPFMVMEFIEGKTLSAVIEERGALPIELCLNIFKQVCNGIDHAHSHGVLHRDLKPSNIMLSDPESWSPHARIVDFGIAKVMDMTEPDSGKLTRTGDLVGSPLYMSPEQCLGKQVDLRSDIYSIGCIMFEALTGKPPLQGDTMMETMLKQMGIEPPSLKEASNGKDFPIWLERLVARTLAKDPTARFQTATELRKAIEERIVAEAPARQTKEEPLFGVKKKALLPIFFAAGALLAVAGMILFYFVLHGQPQLKTAERKPSERLAEQLPGMDLSKRKGGRYDDITLDPTVMQPLSYSTIVADMVADRDKTRISADYHHISDNALAGLKDRVDIVYLDLGGTGITDEALHNARHLPLVRVDLNHNIAITNKVLNYINPEFLEELLLKNTAFNDAGMRNLAKFKDLRVLSVASDGISDAGLAHLVNVPDLISLDLAENPKITDSGLAVLSKLPKLRQLYLSDNTQINGQGLTNVRNLRELTVLFLGGTKCGDSGVIAIEKLPLKKLNLWRTRITDNAIKSIAKMRTLQDLDLTGIRLSSESIKLIANMPLNSLTMADCNLNDQDIIVLSHCKTLRQINLSANPSLTLDGIRAISKLPLQEIVLQKMPLADRNLPIFYDWKNLRTVDFGGCPAITQAGVKLLKARLHPSCSILPFDKPGFNAIPFDAPF